MNRQFYGLLALGIVACCIAFPAIVWVCRAISALGSLAHG